MLDTTKTILVTGAHGFIGGHVARRLDALGYKVRATDIVPKPPFDAPKVGDVIIGNLCDPLFCAHVVQGGVDVVLHFAATMGGMGTIHAVNDFIIYKENSAMTLNLLDASVAAGVGVFFYASSACVYPESLQAPGSDVSLAEDDAWKNPPPHPQGLYGLEKLVSELVLHQYAASGLQLRIARFHNVYGTLGSWNGGREKVPAAFLRKALAAKLSGDSPIRFEIWGDGSQRRSFCYIEDAVEAIIRLLESNYSGPVNVGSEHAVTIQQLADMALSIAGIDPADVTFVYDREKPVGVGSRNSNNALVREKLNWEPEYSLQEGMRLTGEWIHRQINASLPPDEAERRSHLQALQSSDLVDLAADATTFAILLPITSRGSSSPKVCLDNLARFADSLAETTRDDSSRLGERYQVRIYLAIDADDSFLWSSHGGNAAEAVLRARGFQFVVTLPPCTHPRGHVCALWRDCARRAYEDSCDYYILMGDDVVLQDANWMSSIHHAFLQLSTVEGVPHGIGCVAFDDTSFPGMPTFPAVHRVHMDIFRGEVIPDCFINQDGDPYLFQLYRRWRCSRTIPHRIHNRLGGSAAARYDKVHAAQWTFEPLEDATRTVEAWLGQRAPAVTRTMTLDVIIPCYRVKMKYLNAFLDLRPSRTCTVMFIIIVDDPLSPRIGELLQKYGYRPDVRIRVNKENLGASASRNRGLQESSAEWVHFLDDDVTPEKDLLVEAEKAIRTHPDAAGFVGNAHFPSADTVFTTAVHLAGVTYFWNIAEKIEEDVPWGVTANLLARRNVADGVVYNLQFPKTGGGEDIDYCRKKRAFSLSHGREAFYGAPKVKVTHPWWNGGRRSYWRFYMWSKGDGGLVKLYPEHSYRDLSPNSAEMVLLCCLVLAASGVVAFLNLVLALGMLRLDIVLATSVLLANVTYDLTRHLVLHPERNADMKTTLSGAKWVCAVVEGTFIRMFSEWGRVMGILGRGEYGHLFMRFDWFCGVWGDRPRREEMRDNRVRVVLTAVVCVLLSQFA